MNAVRRVWRNEEVSLNRKEICEGIVSDGLYHLTVLRHWTSSVHELTEEAHSCKYVPDELRERRQMLVGVRKRKAKKRSNIKTVVKCHSVMLRN